MPWVIFIIFIGIALAFWRLNRGGLIAGKHLEEAMLAGATVVDLRSEEEWASGHLEEALHLPLNRLSDQAPQVLPEKDKPVLLHCASGVRSGLARTALRRMGYQKVFNFGSLDRARAMLQQASHR